MLSPPCLIRIPILNANSVDPDQTPRSAASDQGLHCLPMSLLWDAKHKLVIIIPFLFSTLCYICTVAITKATKFIL